MTKLEPLKKVSPKLVSILAGLTMALFALPSTAAIYSSETLKFYGDFRTRVEADFDSQDSTGGAREDRDRLRIRARLGLTYTPDNHWEYGMRLRSGSDDSHQSPHITLLDFDDNNTGVANFNFDKWYLKRKGNAGSFWIGRNSLPFWKQNEFFWDDDVMPVGVAGKYTWTLSDNNKIELNAGYLSLPVGMKTFSGDINIAQIVFHGGMYTVAAGMLNVESNSADPESGALQRNNGERDYSTIIVSGQLRMKAGGEKLKFGIDVMSNTEDYALTDPGITTENQDQTEGWDVYVKWGSTKPDQWLFAYYYANIEQFAVSSSYAQDDWVRWGSADETRATDIEGSEFRVAYGLAKKQNLVFRLYVVDSIQTVEDGSRFRTDWNVKF